LIFPRETPCGLHLIGRSPVTLWRQRTGAEFGALLAPGDRVIFTPVSLREYGDMHAKAAEGRLTIAPVDDARDAAA
jgi:allophanate hydrolase subunit 1